MNHPPPLHRGQSRNLVISSILLPSRTLSAALPTLVNYYITGLTPKRKRAVIWLIRSFTQVSCEWIFEQLGLGDRSNIRRAVRALEALGWKDDRLKAIMLQCKD